MDASIDRFCFFMSNYFEVYYLRLGWKAVDDRQCIVYVSSGMVYVGFSPGIFEVYFHVQIKRSCKSKKKKCFLGADRTRRGLVGLKHVYIYTFLTARRNKGT